MNNSIQIVTRFKTHSLTAREYINLSRSFLVNLKQFHSIFSTIHSWGDKPTSWTKIESDFSNFETVVLNHIYDDEIVYTNHAGEKINYSLDAISYFSFSNSYSNVKKPLQEKYSVSIGAGGEDGLGFINIKLPSSCFAEFCKKQAIIELISNLINTIEIEGAYVFTDDLYDKVVDYTKDYDIGIGWINYLKNKDVLLHTPKEMDRKLTKNGAFFWLQDEISEATEEIISTAIKVRDTLGELDYLKIS